MPTRLSAQQRSRFFLATLAGVSMLIVAAAWFSFHEDLPPKADTSEPPLPPVLLASPIIPLAVPTPVLIPPPSSPPPVVDGAPPPVSVVEMESEYRRTADPRERANAAVSVVSIGTAEAVAAAARLFHTERDPRAREALVAALADLPADEFLDVRLSIYTEALARSQPRSLRTAALDALAALDDPRSLALLRRAAREDPDKELREAAAARAQAVAE